MGIKIEGVSFNTEICKEMSKEEFVNKHSEQFSDRSEEDKNRILSGAYDMICPPDKNRKKPSKEKSDAGE